MAQQMKNRFGINFDSNGNLSPEEAFPLFQELGFSCTFSEYADRALANKWVQEARRAGLVFESFHSPFGHINDMWKDGECGDRMLDSLVETVDAASELEVPIVVVHLSSGDEAPCINDIGHARFDRLVEEAVKKNVTVAFENQRKLANIAFVMELYRDIPNVGFCLDLGHEMCFTAGREYMPLFGDRLVYTHIHDNLCEPNGDLHLLPFDGKIDYAKNFEYFRKYGYTGSFTFEVMRGKTELYRGMTAVEYYTRAAQKMQIMKNTYLM